MKWTVNREFEKYGRYVWDNDDGRRIIAERCSSLNGVYYHVTLAYFEENKKGQKRRILSKLGTRCTWEQVLCLVNSR